MEILIRMAASLLVLLLLAAGSGAGAQGQGGPSTPAPAQGRPIEPQEFVQLAHSAATLQSQAAKLAASRDTRPEVKAYAAAAVDFRLGLLRRIETFARERNLTVPATMEFEHRVIIENLEPLDELELSRRYAELEMQALQQEIGIYQAAGRSIDDAIRSFAGQVLPDLERRLGEAGRMYDAIKP